MHSHRNPPPTEHVEDLLDYARRVVSLPEVRVAHAGFVGYGNTKKGDRVLIVVDSLYDRDLVQAVADALRERGARIDIIAVDAGPDKEMDEQEEIRVIIRRKPWHEQPRRYEGFPWAEELAEKMGYDLLIHGVGGPIPRTKHRYEAIPWLTKESFASPATIYPFDLHKLINEKAWAKIWHEGRGGKVKLTDPEGTDLTFTLWDDYYSGPRHGFTEMPLWGHLMGHPPPPLIGKEDASGVVAGTTSHYNKPFPKIKLYFEKGRLVKVEGGGRYGDGWRQLLEETENNHYPEFPDKGLFWLWEVAIGTNPKMRRPSKNLLRLSVGSTEMDRLRSGVIHIGVGTFWRSPAERWAGEFGLPYGHLHVHLLFPTYEITKDGQSISVIQQGRLKSLDDPDVRGAAKKYGGPEELLREDWVPKIPGINAPGNYEEYAQDPVPWILGQANP